MAAAEHGYGERAGIGLDEMYNVGRRYPAPAVMIQTLRIDL